MFALFVEGLLYVRRVRLNELAAFACLQYFVRALYLELCTIADVSRRRSFFTFSSCRVCVSVLVRALWSFAVCCMAVCCTQ